MASKEQCEMMSRFEKEHPGWECYEFNKESVKYKKGNQFLFLDTENIYGPYTEKDIFEFGQAIYTRDLEKFDDKAKKFTESCKEMILKQAELYGLSKGISKKAKDILVSNYIGALRTPLGHDSARDKRSRKAMTYGDYKKLMDEVFRVEDGRATVLGDLIKGREHEQIPSDLYNKCLTIEF